MQEFEARSLTASAHNIKRSRMSQRGYDHQILLLQGGGALGAYQGGVYQGLIDVGFMPTWVVGISIGAINAALIAGNPPERRLERLHEFWNRVSAYAPLTLPTSFGWLRPFWDRLSVWSATVFGIQPFYVPRNPSQLLASDNPSNAVSFYDTGPLKKTLEELVDFDLINRGETRLSLGATNVRTGQPVYFDTVHTRITPEHVMASGALPPGFPLVEIDGEAYWDGGLVSNTPITYVFDQKPLTTAFILQVNLFPSRGPIPRNLEEVMERMKDIEYCSKQLFSVETTRERGELRAAARRLMAKMPGELQADPDVQRIASYCDDRRWTIAFLTESLRSDVGQWKDAEFSRETVNERWEVGVADIRRLLSKGEATLPFAETEGIRVFTFTPATPAAGTGSAKDGDGIRLPDRREFSPAASPLR
jgi:NTE family protein